MIDNVRVALFLLFSDERKGLPQRLLEVSLIGLKLLWLFVNRIVCQVHEEARIDGNFLTRFQFTWVRHWRANILHNDLGVIVFSRKPGQPIFIDKALQFRSHLSDEHIQSKVKLLALNQVRIVLVYLHNLTWISRNVFDLTSEENSLALTWVHGFDNKSWRLLLVLL